MVGSMAYQTTSQDPSFDMKNLQQWSVSLGRNSEASLQLVSVAFFVIKRMKRLIIFLTIAHLLTSSGYP